MTISFIPSPWGRTIVDHDVRNRNYPMRELLPDQPPKTKLWARGKAYDQGQKPWCVGETFKGILNTRPNSSLVAWRIRSKYDAGEIYHGAQLNDDWPGEAYDGTSASGACKYLQSQGRIKEYRWCFGVDDVLDTLSHHGPVAIGVQWTQDCMATNSGGYISPSGAVVGGHEVELRGINVERGYVIGCNSWGTTWGIHGEFFLTFDSLGVLLANQGDAVTTT